MVYEMNCPRQLLNVAIITNWNVKLLVLYKSNIVTGTKRLKATSAFNISNFYGVMLINVAS